jgi:hypothetical protein
VRTAFVEHLATILSTRQTKFCPEPRLIRVVFYSPYSPIPLRRYSPSEGGAAVVTERSRNAGAKKVLKARKPRKLLNHPKFLAFFAA